MSYGSSCLRAAGLSIGFASVVCRGAEIPRALRVGVSGHAFEHLGAIGEQAETAAASGATIIYDSGFGAIGYQGLGTPEELQAAHEGFGSYLAKARGAGIQLAIGYVCATSIV